MTEDEMRAAKVPALTTEAELIAYIHQLVEQPHGYATCAYAMSMSAVAAFNYAAHRLGVTGFQAGFAQLDFLLRMRGSKHGIIIFDADDLLYPQYDFHAKLNEWIADTKPRLKDAAQKLLDDRSSYVSGPVLRHWARLAAAK